MGREVREELAEGKELAGSFFCRMGKLMVEQLLKAEMSETLGRDKGARRESGQAGYRNGYKARTLRTGKGMIELDVPQVRGLADGPYHSPIWQGLGRRSVSPQKLATEVLWQEYEAFTKRDLSIRGDVARGMYLLRL
jgi:hypothetical protein